MGAKLLVIAMQNVCTRSKLDPLGRRRHPADHQTHRTTHLPRRAPQMGRPGRQWALPLADRVLLVAVQWRTNLTMRQIGRLFGVSHAAHRVIDKVGPLLALAPVRKRRVDSVAIVDGTLVPTRDHRLAAPSKNYRYSANAQIAIDADTRLVIATEDPNPATATTPPPTATPASKTNWRIGQSIGQLGRTTVTPGRSNSLVESAGPLSSVLP